MLAPLRWMTVPVDVTRSSPPLADFSATVRGWLPMYPDRSRIELPWRRSTVTSAPRSTPVFWSGAFFSSLDVTRKVTRLLA